MISNKAVYARLRSLFGRRLIIDVESIKYHSLNAGGFTRTVKAVVQPHAAQEVQALIAIANKHAIPLYPISTGKNWGLGSKLPVKNSGIIVDLSKMNDIEINEQHAYALIEPGVTQGQLYDYIQQHRLPFLINVTGSGRETSLLGNALDRGDGYFNLRVDDLKGLEVVLGNGKILKTGFGHYENAVANYLYPHGVGPSMNGLFSQSNYGIVTKAAFALIPKREAHAVIICRLKKESQLSEFIDDIAHLSKQQLWTNIIHVSNKERSKMVLLPILVHFYQQRRSISYQAAHQLAIRAIQKEMNSAWTGIGGISGTRKQIRTAFKIIQKKLSKYGKVSLLNDHKINIAGKTLRALSQFDFFERKYAITQAIKPFFNIAKGIPTNQSIKSLHLKPPYSSTNSKRLVERSTGILFTLPLVPMSGVHVTDLINITEIQFKKYGFKAYITLNTFNTRTLGAVINLLFDKTNKEETAKAKGCIAEMNYLYSQKGYLPYRVSIDGMEQIMNPDDTFWQTARDMKKVFDPNNIISPGRYNLI